jgi:hypothetical protein
MGYHQQATQHYPDEPHNDPLRDSIACLNTPMERDNYIETLCITGEFGDKRSNYFPYLKAGGNRKGVKVCGQESKPDGCGWVFDNEMIVKSV